MGKLQEYVTNHIDTTLKVMTARDCMVSLGWTFDEDETGFMSNIKCCGQKVKLGGWIGTEHAQCPACGKGMQDLFGFLPSGNSSAGLLDPEKFPEESESHKHWIAKTAWNMKPSSQPPTPASAEKEQGE